MDGSQQDQLIARRVRTISIALDGKHRVTLDLADRLQTQRNSTDNKFTRSSLAKGNELHAYEVGDDVQGVITLDIVGGQPVCKVRLALVCLTQVRCSIERRPSIIESLLNADTTQSEIYFDRQKYVDIDLSKTFGKLPAGYFCFLVHRMIH